MRQRKDFYPLPTRRSCLVLLASALAGCGGGDLIAAGPPGTGGTGIYAQGSISGFGSVIINGIRFDDSAATVRLDDIALSSTDLRLGMVASVQGQRGADATLGTASSIEVWSMAQGLVTQALAGGFMVAGMAVQTDDATVFDGIAGAAGLTPGRRVTVWGLQAGADGARWSATRVAITGDTHMVSTGLVTQDGSQRFLNGLQLTGPGAAGMVVGQMARAQGTLLAAGNSLQVDSHRMMGPDSSPALQGEADIEGVVTALLSATRFSLGNVEVDASGASFSPATAKAALGARLSVDGIWQGRVLKATKVELKDTRTPQTVQIEARIEQFTSLANFVVRGQRCDASGATISQGTAADLAVGVKVKLKGSLVGDVLRVATLELSN